jgi:hypothetical protein
VDPAAIKWRI